MSAFSTVKFFNIELNDYSGLVSDLENHFIAQEYEVVSEVSPYGGYNVSIKKGGMFKQVLGMQTSLNVEIIKVNNGTKVEAKVGIFGKQLLPSAITLVVAWPVVLTQIWGLVQQSNLDDEVMAVVEENISKYTHTTSSSERSSDSGQSTFCVECGTKIDGGFKFCPNCGAKRI